MHPIPVRHGRTIGELAKQFREEAFPKTIASFSSFPRTKVIAVIKTSRNRNAVNVRAVGKSKYSAPNAHATQTTAAIQAIAQAMNRSAFMAAITTWPTRVLDRKGDSVPPS